MSVNKIINKRYRIGIDARFYGPVGKGLGRYTQEIVDNILKIDRENEYVIFLGPHNYEAFTANRPRVKKVLINVRWYTLKEQALMPYYIWRERLDLMHFPHFNVPLLCPVKFAVTIHDLILLKYPTPRATTLGPWLYRLKNAGYRAVISSALRRSRRIIAVSEFTKNDVVNVFKPTPEKIAVTYEGVANLAKGRDSLFAATADAGKTMAGFNIHKPFFLYVGNAYPHKNLEGLLRAFKRLVEEKEYAWRLVLVGKEDYFYARIKNLAAEFGLYSLEKNDSPVIFPGYVPDKELEILYKEAAAYVFPSFYEGFGLPPLEAMAKSCPVISSNRASLPEVLADAAMYFDPANEDEIAAKLKTVAMDANLRSDLIRRGLLQAKKYSWWECGRKTWEIYNDILIGKK